MWRTQEDRVPAVLFNQIIWKGLTGGCLTRRRAVSRTTAVTARLC